MRCATSCLATAKAFRAASWSTLGRP
jgi:hypothetical protein